MARKIGKKDNRYLAKLVTEARTPCAFCQREVDDEVTYGKLYAIGDIQCHYFCALLSCCLVQKGPEEEGLFGFMYKDILVELERSKKHKCSFCGRAGANLGCAVGACRKQFHLPCGRERNAVSLYYGSYKSFCQIHAPKQRIPDHIMCKAKLRMKHLNQIKSSTDLLIDANSSDEEMVCVICYEAVDAFPTVNTFWPPCCARDAWFHRTCLQRMALSAGMHYIKCPLCNDKHNFYEAVISQGYYVPDRDAAWELEQNAFAEIYERPLTCTVEDCQCPMGRSHDADQGMWDIKLCLLCGSVGAHAQCMGSSETSRYVCLTCTPAAPTDMQTLADTIEKMILQEQANAASSTRGPLMPCRMSLRRTKGRLANTASSSSSGRDIKTEYESPAQSPTIQSSRQELNLKPPRKLMQSYKSDSHKNMDLVTKSALHPESNKHENNIISPTKLPNESLNDSHNMGQSTNESYNYKQSYNHTELYKNIEAKLLSPMKLLEQSFHEKVACMGMKNAVLDEDVVDKLRRKFRKPRPLCAKKKIVNDILDGLFDNFNSSPKQKDPVREWCSPRKCYDITEEETKSTACENEIKEAENTVDNKENCSQGTPKKYKPIYQKISTPDKVAPKTLRFNNSNEFEDASINEATKVNDKNKLEDASIIKTRRFNANNELEDASIIKTRRFNDNNELEDASIIKTPRFNDNNELEDASIIKTPRFNDNNELEDASIIKTPRFNANNELEDASIIKTPIFHGNNKPEDASIIKTSSFNDTSNFEDPSINKDINKNVNIEENYEDFKVTGDDESSNSTFQLPSEFIAETLSDDSNMEVSSQKRKTIEIKQDSSLEISEKDHTVNIDVIKIDDRPSGISQNQSTMKKKCAFKFSPLDKEKLEEDNVGIDLESFKKEYLNEVDREFKCCFDHKHNTKSLGKINLRTAIDFAVDVHMNVTDLKRNKRKLSEGNLVLSFDKIENKRRKMSENDLDLSFSNSSDDFEVKKAFKSPAKKMIENVEVDKIRERSDQNKNTKKCAKDVEKMHHESRNKRLKNMGFKNKDKIKLRFNDQKRELNEEKSLLERKQESEEKRRKYKKVDSDKTRVEKNVQEKTVQYEDGKIKDEEKNLLDRKLKSEEKHNKNKKVEREKSCIKNTTPVSAKRVVEKVRVNDEKGLLNRKLESKEKYRKLKSEGKCMNEIKLDSERKNIIDRKLENDKRRVKRTNFDSAENVPDKNIQDEGKKQKDEDKSLRVRKLESKEKRRKYKELKGGKRHMKDKKLNSERKRLKDRKRASERRHIKETITDNEERVQEKYVHDENRKLKNEEKHLKDFIRPRQKDSERKRDKKNEKNTKERKQGNDQNIEVTIDSSETKGHKKSKNKLKTKLSISNNKKDISVKIKWKKKQLRLKIESKKAKNENVEKHNSKFKQYVLQYFSEVAPKEVLVKPEKDVSPRKRKYVKQEKSPDKYKQMSIQNFFKVKSTEQ